MTLHLLFEKRKEKRKERSKLGAILGCLWKLALEYVGRSGLLIIFLRCGRKPPLDLKEFSSSHDLNRVGSSSDHEPEH